jgi:hypothetical protein
MNIKDFEDLRMQIESYQKQLLSAKAEEYADTASDRLINFKEGAQLEDRQPEEYLRSLQHKHVLSVKKLIKDLVQHDKLATFEMWREKLIDINTYNILLLALIKERHDNIR